MDTAQPSRVSRFVATVYAVFFNFAHLADCESSPTVLSERG